MASRGWVGASHRRGALALAAFVAALAVAPESHAAAPGYEVTVGVGESDNISLVPSGGKDQTIGVEGVDFTWHDQQSRLGADVDADLQYLECPQHAYSNEVVGNLIGDLRGTLVPQMLFWDLADNFGQGRVNPAQAVTPANRENINYFSTGPELAVPLTATTLIDLTANYAKTTYQVSPLDGDRISGGLSLLRKLSADTSVSINLRDTRIDYSNDVLNEDYSRQDAFVRFDTHGQRTVIGMDLGFSKLVTLYRRSAGCSRACNCRARFRLSPPWRFRTDISIPTPLMLSASGRPSAARISPPSRGRNRVRRSRATVPHSRGTSNAAGLVSASASSTTKMPISSPVRSTTNAHR